MTHETEQTPEQGDLSDWQYVVMISLLRINDALAALAEEISPGAGKRLYAIQERGETIMPDPKLNGEFGTGFDDGSSRDTNEEG